jgi:hypothetical protein
MAVYISPQVDVTVSFKELYGTLKNLETSYPESAFVVAGDLSKEI